MGTWLAAAAIGVPALLFTLWPLVRRREAPPSILPLAPDAREQLLERRAAALRALRELEFEHGAGHVSDADHAELRARYEAETAAILTELDRLGAGARPVPARSAPAPRSGWRHPAGLAAGAVALVVFGVVLGVGVVRYTEPDPLAGVPPTGSRPLAALTSPPGGDGSPAGGDGSSAGAEGPAPRALTPEMLQGMLQAARASLFDGRYQEAIAAYRAVLKRDPDNVDAMTHLALIVAIGGHADAALETFERALAIDPNYPPALLYRGQVLLEAKQDATGAIRSWEKFVAVVPAGAERERVARLIAEARARPAPAPTPR
jgi:cytochrome c-type biogenesis protein CcmH/NrfG